VSTVPSSAFNQTPASCDHQIQEHSTMINVVDLYGFWQGRIGRLVHVLAVIALIVVAVILDLIINATLGEAVRELVSVIMIYPFWVLSVKRAHDLGKSGWWVFGWVMAVVPAVCIAAVAAQFPTLNIVAIPLVLALVLLSVWNSVIKLFFFPGDTERNEYGPPPRPGANTFEPASDGAAARPTARMAASSPAAATASSLRAPRGITPNNPRPAGFGRRTTA
jgi:uncharacterized membrane protein YhaH (DUF805 family)